MRKGLLVSAIVVMAWMGVGCEETQKAQPAAKEQQLSAGNSMRLAAVDLRCEYMQDPQGIDALQPRLFWKISATNRGAMQTAYQILVASGADKLAENQGDLWDSGKVASSDSIQIEYAGAKLSSGQACFWKVRVWNEKGNEGQWSRPALWTMGLLKADDWKGKWIGKDEAAAAAGANPLSSAMWIWHEEKANQQAPIGKRFFRKAFDLPQGRKVAKAMAHFAGDNNYEVWINGQSVVKGSGWPQAQTQDVTARIGAHNVVAVCVENAGAEANPAGLIGAIELTLDNNEKMSIFTDASWKSNGEALDKFTEVAFDDSAWKAASVVAKFGDGPWGVVACGSDATILPARMLRKEFAAGKPVRRAMAYICGLGYYELYLNGRKVGNHVLDPILTEYNVRDAYVTYDVTAQIANGGNAVGAILGNGRYFAPRGKVPTNTRTYGYPKMILQLAIEYGDGSTETIVSDESWKLTTDGPIRENNDYDGEVYDARKEMPGWDKAGFDDSKWETAKVVEAPKGKLAAQMMPPMRVNETIRPLSLNEISPGVWIYDLGQNMVGWCRLKVSGQAGTTIQLRHAETLRKDGTLYVDNLRSAACRDTYTLKGAGVESYEPRFAYHGFRFVELTGFSGKPDLDTIEGRVVHTDMKTVGTFECSNPLLTQMAKNIFWGLRGNYLSIPTDCPQRDERQGWQGDRAAESKGETYWFDNVTLYSKWLQDIEESQTKEGNLSDVCPPFWPLYSANVTWPSAFMIVPETLYTQFGDKRAFAIHFDAMVKWMDHLATFIKDDLIDKDNYGDWCVPPESPELIHSNDPARKTSAKVLASSYYIHNLQLLAKYAEMLGQQDKAKTFRDRADKMNKAFHAKLFSADKGLYDNGTQTSCVLPLAFGLTPDDQRAKVFGNLVDNITNKTQNHIGTGLIGGQWLMRTLSENGRADLAYTLAATRDYPSWGYMIDQGATTVWELWNGNTADPAMNSGNHVMLVGDLGIWMYEYLGGIRTDPGHPGFGKIVIRPYPVGDLKHVKASYASIRGLIASEWSIDGGKFKLNVTIPAGTTATIMLPAAGPVLEGGKDAATAAGVMKVESRDGMSIIEVGSGQYVFETIGLKI
jgi:alpha-L-rhamnosidase